MGRRFLTSVAQLVLLPPAAMLFGAWTLWPFGESTVSSVSPQGTGPYAATSKMLKRSKTPGEWPFTVKEVMIIGSVDCSAFVFGQDTVFALNRLAQVGDSVVINGLRYPAHDLAEPGSIWGFDDSVQVAGSSNLHREGLSSVLREALSLTKGCADNKEAREIRN